MDYNLYITLREEDLAKVGIFEKKASWGGERISYSPRRFVFEDKEYFCFLEMSISSRLKQFDVQNLVSLRIMEGLRELEWVVNRNMENLKSNDIIRMLEKICQLEKFSIIIFEDDEIVGQRIEYTDGRDICSLICLALNWESPKNIEIFCR